VTLVGFGSRFKDTQMGGFDTIDPDELPRGYEKLPPEQQQRKFEERKQLKDVYQWEFNLLGELVAGTLAIPAATAQPEAAKPSVGRSGIPSYKRPARP
jgi:hypothetical protein